MNVFFSTPAMSDIFSPKGHIAGMLRFEAALARAEARIGIIPQEAASAIAGQCHEEFFDSEALYQESVQAGTPAIPLVRMLTERVEGEAKRFVHWGATSQDAIDTALMLQMRDGIDHLLTGLLHIGAACAALVREHRHTPMVGRTLLQQAIPITFGLKAARWLALVTRQIIALRERRERSLMVQLGGATGTLASLGEKGPQVVEFLALELQLGVPDLPWHTERDRIGEITTTCGIIAGAMAKIANDIVHLAQTEVGEAAEGTMPGKGGSSAMPQKHNPVDAMRTLAAARLVPASVSVILSAMVQEHERAVGGWQAEWAALPELFSATAATIEGIQNALAGLQVDPGRMQANLNLTGSLVMSESLTMALAAHMGKPEAYRLVQNLCKQVIDSGDNLQHIALTEKQVTDVLSPEEITHALDPVAYLGSTDMFIDRALASYQQVCG